MQLILIKILQVQFWEHFYGNECQYGLHLFYEYVTCIKLCFEMLVIIWIKEINYNTYYHNVTIHFKVEVRLIVKAVNYFNYIFQNN